MISKERLEQLIKEEAEWYQLTHRTKVVEAPVLPSWEELKDKKPEMLGTDNLKICIDYPYKEDCGFIVLLLIKENKNIYDIQETYNKQNYIKAVKKFYELWEEEK